MDASSLEDGYAVSGFPNDQPVAGVSHVALVAARPFPLQGVHVVALAQYGFGRVRVGRN